MKATQISIGRYHHFHLARQLEKRGLLSRIYTGYPKFKLRDEDGIPPEKIHTFPWIYTPFIALNRFGLSDRTSKGMVWLACNSLDRFVASQVKEPTSLIALSGIGLHAGKKTQRTGGIYICDRGSSHIRFQNNILHEEYKRWKLDFPGVDPRMIRKEEEEYAAADYISLPSEFVRRTFIEKGIPENKLIKIPYGARLERFYKEGEAPDDSFRVLWVGTVSIRKGFFYLLEAFAQFKHPKKELIVVGPVMDEIKNGLSERNLDNVVFKGVVANQELRQIYSTAHAFVLPSLEEGLAMVQGEALACGCPVIATSHTGAEDLFTDGVEGFIVPIRSSQAITHRLNELASDRNKQKAMSAAAIGRVRSVKGWDTYGSNFEKLIKSFQPR